ncbi:MAG: radical SAM family heme chaperone HemW [Planctomycetes bacterium]|nr:radical SAM family heme chaperone HemW [Planctomycetota bacterium]
MSEPATPWTRADPTLARGVPDETPRRERAAAGTPLYVHLPFCAAKCHYCDFFSVPAEGHDRAAMIAAILREAELFAPRAPRTVFFGGGTPSLLSIAELTMLLDGLDRITGFRGAALEVTAECNPESLDRDKARAFLDLGVRRLSIGFQSLHDDVLKLFGRVHGVDDSFRAFEAARAAGVQELNVDLIYAVPGQTAEAWSTDLTRVLRLGSEHLSAYNLTFEEDTVFRRWLEQGRLAKSPEDVELDLFELTRELTRAHGLEAYEISNFARAGHACEHNLNYWRNGEYLGIGPSAVSKQGTRRLGNVKAIGAYARRIQETGNALHWEEDPPASTRLAESWWLGLRLAEGVSAREAAERARFEGDDSAARKLAGELEEQGLLERQEDRLRLSARGLPLGDWVAKRFLDTLS